MSMRDNAQDALDFRFGTDHAAPWQQHDSVALALAARGSQRKYRPEPLPKSLIETLCAAALCSPTKSDLQGRDIVIVEDRGIRSRINDLLTAGPQGQDWIPGAPHLLVFCGNNRRQRLWHEWHGVPFANDHLDAFFNAAVDAGIALSAFMLAAEAQGIGACPISIVRNYADEISSLLGLPQHVFPVSGLAVGWPAETPRLSMRLPLDVTVHTDRYTETDLRERIASYDARRQAAQPYRRQRDTARFGTSSAYGWSEEKARQYASPERADFGAFVRRKGFNLE
jgi:nitroreductase/FMN reductase [NAD(P)H]